ncbi:MAG: hypothetical protein HKN74_04745 [Acidimicrobiia bacterium]|nr:hypothetical protein [Acidimicrobiia bacterium]NNF09573.1 hypothetical protein [Acidimicrobiia bacterium]NNL68549.1 hypothetical protein [Acidimicrobiia bacterium]
MREWADGSKPDLVGRAEMAERLGVGVSTIDRWQRRSILPEPDLRFGPQDVWLWDTVREWAKHKSRFRRKRQAVEVPDVVDLDGLAVRLGVDDRTIEQWQRRRFLPEPDYRWESADGWLWANVQRWARTSLAGSHESRGIPEPAVRTQTPSGPRLAVAVTPAAAPVGSIQNGKAGTAVGQAEAPNPIAEMDRIGRYFSSLAADLRPIEATAD